MLNNTYDLKGFVMNFKKTLLFFTIATAVSVALRTLIIFFTTDSSSGFFKQEFSVFSYGMIGIIIVAAAFCAVYSFKSKEANAPSFWKYIVAVISVLLGISILVETVFFDSSANVAPWHNFMQTLFGILSAAVFIWYGGAVTGFLPAPDFFLAIPVVFYIFRLIVVFITYASLATIADNAFELANLCVTLIFMIKFAKTTAVGKGDTEKIGILPVGICAAFVIFTQCLPIAIALISGNANLVHSNSLFVPSSILMGLFIIANSIFGTIKIHTTSLSYRPRHGNVSGLSLQDLFSKQDDE